MNPLEVPLFLATFLCSLVAGFLFAFAVVVMAGLRSLDDRAFVRAFQVMDRVIQNNQPIFVAVWAGSVIALIAAALFGFRQLQGGEWWLLFGTVLTYLLGVQLTTFTINVPLNNRLQSLDVDALDDARLQQERTGFEGRWVRWNLSRTVWSSLVSLSLILLSLRV
ncbi:MAG: anthrone oxygenase family protein [Candidatus Thiodiazotropha sp.]